MIRRLAIFGLAFGLVAAAADARLPGRAFRGAPQGGGGGGGGGTSSACDSGGSGVCAQFQNGQTFVTWTDKASGAAGNSWRYKVVRSLSPITSGNVSSATEIASSIVNNSAQLPLGNPFNGGGDDPFDQSFRQNATEPMTSLSDLGTGLPLWSGLQVHTALATQSAYYAVIGTSGGVDTYIGSVGAIAESVATPQPIKVADSMSRGTGYGQILTPTGKPLVLHAHASSPAAGCNLHYCNVGDYWNMYMTANSSTWQEGRPMPFTVLQDNGGHLPGTVGAMMMAWRDTILDPTGTTGMETYHWGVGMTPNPAVGPANRLYPVTANAIERLANWTVSHYPVDPNAVHWEGLSMGAWAAPVPLHMTNPRVAAMWLKQPTWQRWRRDAGGWVAWQWLAGYPFKATVGAAPDTLGTVATSVLTETGAVWGGAGGVIDNPGWITSHPTTDFPFIDWGATNADDGAPTNWIEQLAMSNALQADHAGHAWVWTIGNHDTVSDTTGVIDCDNGAAIDTTLCYHKSLFRLNLPYIAFSNSSIDDNQGTGATLANGLNDSDWTGGRNIGFVWNVSLDTSGQFNFTVGNNYMNHSPTTHPATTLTQSMSTSQTGTISVGNTSAFKSCSYALLSGNEIVVLSGWTSNTINVVFRAQTNTSAHTHANGDTVTQIGCVPTGPMAGPFTTMTVDMTPRRIQNFTKTNGTTVSCVVTPSGGSPTTLTPTVANGLFTLPAVTINSAGSTDVKCS